MTADDLPSRTPSRPPPNAPPPVAGVEINVCRNTLCAHFGLPPQVARGARGTGLHRIVISGGEVALRCLGCGRSATLKSNAGVVEEFERQRAYLTQGVLLCRTAACATLPRALERHGRTPSGSPRFRCRHCGRTVSQPVAATWKQKRPETNAAVLRLLVNKVPMRRILEVADISAPTLYRKIGFLHEQCQRFAAQLEVRIRDLPIAQWSLGTDRQDYLVNWGSHLDRRSFVLRGVITADNRSGYVLGVHTNFDAALDPMATERQARACGDYDRRLYDRQFARIWLAGDYVARALAHGRQTGPVSTQPTQPGLLSDDAEAFLENFEAKRPARGVQVRQEYVTFAHYLFLKALLPPNADITLNIDREPALRHCALAVFADAITAGRVRAFVLDITKGMTVEERGRHLLQAATRIEKQRKLTGGKRDDAAIELLRQAIAAAGAEGESATRWIPHPKPHRAEPEKRVLMASPRATDDPAVVASQMLEATLSYVDRFMMIVRRRLSLLERPLKMYELRSWFAYSPYNPQVACRVLELLRVVYNLHLAGKDGKTPAMRLGLTERPLSLDEIVGIPRVASERRTRGR